MFGNIGFMLPTSGSQRAPPKDVPPPTPINLPRCCPEIPESKASDRQGSTSSGVPEPLTSVLQKIIRPAELSMSHFEALGVHVIPNATPAQLLPDPAYIPDFAAWDALSADEVHTVNESTRKPLNTGNLSPGCQTYLERRRELSIANEAAYRTVRRMPAPKGQPQARLGNAYEFYRHLELFASYWEDTSKPRAAPDAEADQSGDSNGENADAATDGGKPAEEGEAAAFSRTGAGHQMPPDYRQTMITVFLKLVAYDFTCNVTAPRTEPRLQITNKPPNDPPRSSYFSSGCVFVFRTPTTREAARAGIVEGPIAAVSARHTITFPPAESATGKDRESALDLAREVIAALITAQHRAREGHTEKRIGEDAWWCTKPRWGGGSGGPIGREVEMLSGADQTVGDKDAPLPDTKPASFGPTAAPQGPYSRPSGASGLAIHAAGGGLMASSSGPFKGVKRQKKSGNHPMYDNYRMVRPPAATWDRRAKYEAIGRAHGADYDDVFVISAVLHHVSIVRVRVPDRLLAVLAGESDEGERASGNGDARSWGKLEMWRSPWFDFFQVDERVQAMQLIWCMMAWTMREQPPPNEVKQEDARNGGRGGASTGDQQSQDDVKMSGA
ncbi:uncharacterized protein C8A04DRAFT_9680 [Dichotomopilus funicola]|uniref:Uncharacterized protein n=1 Tax=Dichotomopilus funicola TaxID=1934379 RepID=A0AAN6ZQ00_9PEZI|nr:hypothetical protein C8A04DRAFT_9680 [Dichotomopilus funicola]